MTFQIAAPNAKRDSYQAALPWELTISTGAELRKTKTRLEHCWNVHAAGTTHAAAITWGSFTRAAVAYRRMSPTRFNSISGCALAITCPRAGSFGRGIALAVG